jgi:hypothetical protein
VQKDIDLCPFCVLFSAISARIDDYSSSA